MWGKKTILSKSFASRYIQHGHLSHIFLLLKTASSGILLAAVLKVLGEVCVQMKSVIGAN